MRGSIFLRILDKLDEDLAPVGKNVALFYGNIVFCAGPCEEGIEHFAHHLKICHSIVILNADQIIK